VGNETMIAFIGNKTDLAGDIGTAAAAGKQIASDRRFVFATTSAQTGVGVNEFFQNFLAKLITMKKVNSRMTINELERIESG
jgi:hypothetical protein